MKFNITRSRVRLQPDEEKGPSHIGGVPTGDHHVGGEQSANDDADNNDQFWKLFLEEAANEAKWKVSIWKTELDSLLVFAGLFAAVVSAFLVDLRTHLRPDPQLIALNKIASILQNISAPDPEKPTTILVTTGSLWYGSLVITLIGALWGVLAQGWLGQVLREPPDSPANRALERWKRDNAARYWYMDNVITGVPILTQIGLAMFLSGFVIQSFDDNHSIGLGVLVFVILGVFGYTVFTLLPWVRPDCPYGTPVTTFLHPVVPNITIAKVGDDANIGSKIEILVSRLNRSANDEIFCAAASMLDVKLESDAWKNWYQGVAEKASEITDALSVRLQSFAHRVETITEGPMSSKRTASSGTNKESFAGALFLPIEQGISCLRALLRSVEASMSSEGDTVRSPWITQDIDPQWISSNIFPETWRLLSLSLHITRLVAQKADYDKDRIVGTDWQTMIRKTFSDLTLRTISGTSACRGLLQGEENLKRLCALGLAMFIEIRATTVRPTDLPKQIFDDKTLERGKEITRRLWSELVAIWKNGAIQLVRDIREWDQSEDSVIELLQKDLYNSSDTNHAIIGIIFEQLDSANLATQTQALQKLTKFSESDADMFDEATEPAKVILKVVDKLKSGNEDVRSAASAALLTLSAHERYHSHIKSSIPIIVEQLDDTIWDVREQTVKLFGKLSEFEMFQVPSNVEGAIPKVVAKLGDEDDDVRVAAIAALEAFLLHESYYPVILSKIPDIIKELDNEGWEIRQQTVQMLTKLSEFDTFRGSLNTTGAISKIVSKLEDDDGVVCAAANDALKAFNAHELYHSDIKSSVLKIIEKLDNEDWETRQQTIELLGKLSELEMFRESFDIVGVIPKLVAKLEDDDSVVREAAIESLEAFSTHDLYHPDIKSSVPTIIKQLDHKDGTIRSEAARMLTRLSGHDALKESIKDGGAFLKLITKLEDNNGARTEAVKALLALATRPQINKKMKSDDIAPNLSSNVSDNEEGLLSEAIQAIKSSIDIRSVVKQLQDTDWEARQQAVQLLAQLAPHVEFQTTMDTEKTVSVLVTMLTGDGDGDVRAAIAEALSVFGEQEIFQKTLKSGTVILKLADKLSDSFDIVRDAAQSTVLNLSRKGFFQDDIKSVIPNIIRQLDDKGWDTRQEVIQLLAKLSEKAVFQETMKTEMTVAKLTVKLEDYDEDVRTAAAQALSALGTKDPFKQAIKDGKAIPKLIARLTDFDEKVCTAVHDTLLALGKQGDISEFLQTVVSTLNTVDQSVREEVYKLLTELRTVAPSEEAFVKEIDAAICRLLTLMKDKDLFFIRRAIAILTETEKAELRGDDLDEPNATNRPARDAVETVVRSKLAYSKESPDRNGVVRALSRLSKHEVFLGSLKPAIPGLIEAINDNDANVWSAAVGAISALSVKDELRADLVPAIQKLIQKLSQWDEDEKNGPVNVLSNEAKASLAEDLLTLVTNFIENDQLTMIDRIALASSLRIVSPVSAPLETRVCKLNLATVLVPDSDETFSDDDYSSFLSVVLGNDNNIVKSKLARIFSFQELGSKSSVPSK